jgi:hypothetical protein
MWIGPQVGCPPARGECPAITGGALEGITDAERSRVAQVVMVQLPTHFVTAGGQPRSPRLHEGIGEFAAALVTLDDGSQRAVGLECLFPYNPDGTVQASRAHCGPARLRDWQDGAVPPSFPPGTVFG